MRKAVCSSSEYGHSTWGQSQSVSQTRLRQEFKLHDLHQGFSKHSRQHCPSDGLAWQALWFTSRARSNMELLFDVCTGCRQWPSRRTQSVLKAVKSICIAALVDIPAGLTRATTSTTSRSRRRSENGSRFPKRGRVAHVLSIS